MKLPLYVAAAMSVMSLVLAPVALAANYTVIVRASDPQGWIFNVDSRNSTPYEFTSAEASIGSGSLYVKPIGTNAPDKFTADKGVAMPVAVLSSFAYDFQLAGSAVASDANKTYLNVYANIDNSAKYYDCRFDYAPSTGSTAAFTTASFATTSTPVNVQQSGSPRTTCPATLAAMPSGSYVRAVTLNVGDTSTSDTGLAAFLDRVVVSTNTDSTVYDFEPELTYPASKDECKKDGYKSFTGQIFNNQGECVSYVASNDKARNNLSNNPSY